MVKRLIDINEILNTSALMETRISNTQAADIGLLTKVTVVSAHRDTPPILLYLLLANKQFTGLSPLGSGNCKFSRSETLSVTNLDIASRPSSA
jgi:hypothetical protein